ncbi:DUF6228 family protein [Spirillospora sp. NPDC049652]
MDHEDPALSGSPQVTVRCARTPRMVVQLADRQFIDDYETVFALGVQADGLHATIPDLTLARWDPDGGLDGFLQTLVDDFRGWTGDRSWNTNQLMLQATFRSGGHIELVWTLRPWPSQQGRWTTSVTTWLEGGEQMNALAADVAAFLARP